MANFIHPKRWTNKPSIGVQINWGHPLARGLVLCFPCNEGGGFPVDRVQNVKTVAGAGGTPTWTPRSLGVGSSPTSTAIAFTVFDPLVSLTDFTIFSVFELTTTRASATSAYNLGFARWGATVPDQYVMLRINSATQTRFAAALSTTNADLTVTDNFAQGVNTIAARLTASKAELFGNGVLLTGSNQGTGTVVAATNGYYLYCGSGSLIGINPHIGHGCYVYTRALQASEVSWLQAEPYAIFIPRSPRISYFAPPDTVSLVGQYSIK